MGESDFWIIYLHYIPAVINVPFHEQFIDLTLIYIIYMT